MLLDDCYQQRPLPTDGDVQAVVAERVTTLLEARFRQRDRLKTERSQRFVPLARNLADNEDASPLIAMLLDDYYQQTLHAPVARLPRPAVPGAKSNRKPGRRHPRSGSARLGKYNRR